MEVVRSRAPLAALVSSAAGAAALLAPELAAADLLAPDSPASSTADSARTLYIVMTIIAVLIVLVVLGAIARALRSRAPEGASGTRRIRGDGSTQLRAGLAIGALTLILFSIGVIWTADDENVPYLLSGNKAAAATNEPITIKADAQQWLWRYAYPVDNPAADGFNVDQAYSYHELVVPVDTPINLEITSIDVLHTWSVPALAPTVQAVPGVTSEVSFTAEETGSFAGRSTRFSGPGYETMRTRVDVVEPDEYEKFLTARSEGIVAARQAVQERVQSGTAPGVRFEQK